MSLSRGTHILKKKKKKKKIQMLETVVTDAESVGQAVY